MSQMESDEERAAYLKDMQPAEGKELKRMLPKIIYSGYEALNLQHFFTCGPDEVRCWSVQKGWKAPQVFKSF